MNTTEYNLPVITLRGMTVLPEMVIHFDVSRMKSVHAVEKSMTENQKVFLVTQKKSEKIEPGLKDVFQVGTIARIKQIIKLSNDIVRILVEGIEKGFLNRLSEQEGVLHAQVSVPSEAEIFLDEMTQKAMLLNLHELLKTYAAVNPKISKDIIKQLVDMKDITSLIRRISIDFPMDYTDRQKFLEADSIEEQYEMLAKLLLEETEISRIRDELVQKVRGRVEQNQREYVFREQLKILHKELGEEDAGSETESYEKAVKKLKATAEVKTRINKEIKRYKALSGSTAESNVARSYIETLLELPWDKVTKDNKDIKRAEEILNEDHYGLEKVKERILEFLAVRIFAKKGDTPILCLAGPPGTGKTSVARSVARALNKEYVRVCLGGVRDEAEIRGHRRTYIGAMPGRIIEGLKTAGVKNPLMLLDEIDKISSDYKGDTASALLEVLDSEQNIHFRDHYVEIPTDLSEVVFLATANDLSNISKPLLDRMEIIEISSYTQNEKMHIAKEHLISKQLSKHGLTERNLHFTDKAIIGMIEGYTKEAGVRNLERKIGAVCRKVVKERLNQKQEQQNKEKFRKIEITDSNLADFLGKVKYEKEKASRTDEIGIVCGLAWTSAGGNTLQIEVNTMPGKGELKLTGQMGDVMKESAEIALSYVRSVASDPKYKVAKDYFEKHSLHIHIPEGAIPKDGPSAGITMASAILSAAAKIPVRASVAMTGEITLRGRVLPVGGLKEKLLAAKTAGIKTVLVPAKNRLDIAEFAGEITKGLKITYINTMEEVIASAFVL